MKQGKLEHNLCPYVGHKLNYYYKPKKKKTQKQTNLKFNENGKVLAYCHAFDTKLKREYE